jgi:hypothetical protein
MTEQKTLLPGVPTIADLPRDAETDDGPASTDSILKFLQDCSLGEAKQIEHAATTRMTSLLVGKRPEHDGEEEDCARRLCGKRVECYDRDTQVCHPTACCRSRRCAIPCGRFLTCCGCGIFLYILFTLCVLLAVQVDWIYIHTSNDDSEYLMCVTPMTANVTRNQTRDYLDVHIWDTGRHEYQVWNRDSVGLLDFSFHLYGNATENRTWSPVEVLPESSDRFIWQVNVLPDHAWTCDGIAFLVLSDRLNSTETDFGSPLAVYPPGSFDFSFL